MGFAYRRSAFPVAVVLAASCVGLSSESALAAPPAAGNPSFPEAVARMTKPVVNISTRRVVSRAHRRPMRDNEESSQGDGTPSEGARNGVEGFFDRFFGNRGGSELRRSLGSGILIDGSGYVLTNDHVIGDAIEIRVTLSDERSFSARVVGRDARTDVALLKIDAHDLPAASLGDSESLRVGDSVVAIGNPFGLRETVTTGIVSAKGRVLGEGPYDDFIQTDASINPGNSGGPLYDLEGHVIGLNTAIVDGAKGIGFAIPVNLVKTILPQLRARGRVVRGFLGVSVQHVTPSLARAFGLGDTAGALASSIDNGGPAEKAGLRVGDVIREVNGRRVATSDRLAELVAENAPGSRATLSVERDGRPLRLVATLGALKDEDDEKQKVAGHITDAVRRPGSLGVAVRPLRPDEVSKLGENGLRVEQVDPDGAAAGSIETGDVIVEVNRRPLHSADQLLAAARVSLKNDGRPLLLRVRRGDGSLFVTVDGE